MPARGTRGSFAELPKIRATGLAYTLGRTPRGTFIVAATPLRDRDGQFAASIATVMDSDYHRDVEATGIQRSHESSSEVAMPGEGAHRRLCPNSPLVGG